MVNIQQTTNHYLITTIKKNIQSGRYDKSYQEELCALSTEGESKIIESLILGIPLPMGYIYVNKTPNKVIRGRNILCAIEDYCIKQSFALEGLKIAHEYNGLKYSDLSPTVQYNILQSKWSVTLLNIPHIMSDELAKMMDRICAEG